MVERILPVAGTGDLTQIIQPAGCPSSGAVSDLTQFKQLFNKSVRKKMTNDHLWVSVFSLPLLECDFPPLTLGCRCFPAVSLVIFALSQFLVSRPLICERCFVPTLPVCFPPCHLYGVLTCSGFLSLVVGVGVSPLSHLCVFPSSQLC